MSPFALLELTLLGRAWPFKSRDCVIDLAMVATLTLLQAVKASPRRRKDSSLSCNSGLTRVLSSCCSYCRFEYISQLKPTWKLPVKE